LTGLLSNEEIKRLCDALADGSGGELALKDAHDLILYAEEHLAAAALITGVIKGTFLVRRGADGEWEFPLREGEAPAA
jgi:hypothetical protein